jgi:hypothetical protein
MCTPLPSQVTLVINYDVPVERDAKVPAYETYLHRIGRSGRFGRKGAAFNLVAGAQASLYSRFLLPAVLSVRADAMKGQIQRHTPGPLHLAAVVTHIRHPNMQRTKLYWLLSSSLTLLCCALSLGAGRPHHAHDLQLLQQADGGAGVG